MCPIPYTRGSWSWASNVCLNKYKATDFSSCVLPPPNAHSTASAIGAAGIQRGRKSRTLGRRSSPCPPNVCFEVWSFVFWNLKFMGCPKWNKGETSHLLCDTWEMARNPSLIQRLSLLCPLWFHAGGDFSTLHSHRVTWTLCTAFLNLFLWDGSLALCNAEKLKPSKTRAAKKTDNHQLNSVGRRWNGSYKTWGLLLLLSNTYVDVNSISMPAS